MSKLQAPDKQRFTRDRLKTLPKLPGVYLMKDADGEVLYVGKAKNLRSRVRSYFSGGDGRYRVQFLVTQIYDIETLVTEDERQALILESDLIKKFKPRYNVRLKDDKAYLVVRLDKNVEWPRLEVVRQIREDGARYFGPYAFGYEVRALLDVIKKTLPLRTCSDRMLHNRVRPCLEHQIKRCSGPCCIDVDKMQYQSWVEEAEQILEGRIDDVLQGLRFTMEEASEQLRFEDAAHIRDRIEVLERVFEEQPRYAVVPGSRDAIGLYREGSRVEFSVLMVRQGRLIGSKTFGFSDVDLPQDELLGTLMSQYYSDAAAGADEILLPFGLEDMDVREQLYTERLELPVKIKVPKRGHKAKLVVLAGANAKENFRARFSDIGNEDLLAGLRDRLGLSELPRTIECVDVSHFQGQGTVASVVSFRDGKPDKNRYRRFRLSQEGKPDDFASMREVVMRHLSRAVEENELVDLMVVDGGPAQLSQALQQRKELGLDAPEMIGLAKKRAPRVGIQKPHQTKEPIEAAKPERVYTEYSNLPIVLEPHSDAMLLLERVRDEAHRFAITFHRKSRSKRMFRSALEAIQGVGPRRRRELLKVFGSIKAIRSADPEELNERCSIPLALAERIVSTLQERKTNRD